MKEEILSHISSLFDLLDQLDLTADYTNSRRIGMAVCMLSDFAGVVDQIIASRVASESAGSAEAKDQ